MSELQHEQSGERSIASRFDTNRDDFVADERILKKNTKKCIDKINVKATEFVSRDSS